MQAGMSRLLSYPVLRLLFAAMRVNTIFTFLCLLVPAVWTMNITDRGHFRRFGLSQKYFWFEVYETEKEGKPKWPEWPQFAHVKQYCADMKMKLPLPESFEENDFLGFAINETWPDHDVSYREGFYIDLTDEEFESEWKNSAGEVVWRGKSEKYGGSAQNGHWTYWIGNNIPQYWGDDDDWAVAQSRRGYDYKPWAWMDTDSSRVYSTFFVCEGTLCLDTLEIPVDTSAEVTVTINVKPKQTAIMVDDTVAFECPSGQFVVIDGELSPAQKVEYACWNLRPQKIECGNAIPTCTIPNVENGQLDIQPATLPRNAVVQGKEFNIDCDKGYVTAAEANGLSSFSCIAQDQFNVEPTCLRECASTFVRNGGFEGFTAGTKIAEGIPIKRTCDSGMKSSIEEDAICLPSGKINEKHECIPVVDNTPVIAGAVGGTIIAVLLGVGCIVYRVKKRAGNK